MVLAWLPSTGYCTLWSYLLALLSYACPSWSWNVVNLTEKSFPCSRSPFFCVHIANDPNGLLGDWRQQQEGKSRDVFKNKSTLFGPESTCRCVPQTCWGHGRVNGTTRRILCPWVLRRDDMAEVPNSAAKWEQAENDPTLPKWPFSKRL